MRETWASLLSWLRDPSRERLREHGATWLIVLVGSIWSAVLALRSDGVYQDDDLTHFLFARWAWEDPRYLIDIWGRPGFTVPYALVSNVGSYETGFRCARLFSVVIAAVSALLSSGVARRLGLRYPAAAAAALMAMPIYFQISYTTLTETICGLYFIGFTYLVLRERDHAAAALLALAPLARFEAIFVLVPAAAYFAWRRKWIAIALLGWAEVVWNIFGKLYLWIVPYKAVYLSPKRTNEYGWGGPLHFVMMWADTITIVGIGLVFAGSLWLAMHKGGVFGLFARIDDESLNARNERIRASLMRVCCVGGALGVVALQTWIYMTSPFASGGYARFLVPGCPWMAVCVAGALDVVLHTLLRRSDDVPSRRERWITHAMGVLIALGIVFAFIAIRSGGEAPKWTRVNFRWWGPQLLALKETWAIVLVAALAFAAVPTRTVALCMLLAFGTHVSAMWKLRAKPHMLNPAQKLIGRAIHFVREERGLKGPIIGFSPWIAWFDHQTLPSIRRAATQRWETDEPGIILLFDTSLGPWTMLDEYRKHVKTIDDSTMLSRFQASMDAINRQPNEKILELPLGNRFYQDPYLQVFVKTGKRVEP